MPVVWASRLLGKPLPERVAGSDLFPALCAKAAEHNLSVFFLGGARGTAQGAAKVLQARHPRLRVAGTYCPTYEFERDPTESEQVLEAVRVAKPDTLIVGLGSPKQEEWIVANRAACGAKLSIGVGISFSFLCDDVTRPRAGCSASALEWAHRLLQEARRLWKRYLMEDTAFIRLFLGRLLKRRRTLITLIISFLVSLMLVEGAIRILTGTTDSGMPQLRRVVLLPYRPDADKIGAWWDRTAESTYIIRDSDLGWTIAESGRVESVGYYANAQGIRTQPDRLFDPALPKDKIRIVVVGDSFTHCDDVGLEDTWPYQMEMMRPELEVLNFGVPAYGTDQAFLRWRRDGCKYKSHLVILGIWPENICRNLNVIRYYLQPQSGFAPKPRFRLDGDDLVLVNSPIPNRKHLIRAMTSPSDSTLLKNEHWISEDELEFKAYYHVRTLRVVASAFNMYRRRNLRNRFYSGEDERAIRLTVAIAKRFSHDVEAAGSIPIVLVLPMSDLLETYKEENSLPLARKLRESELNVIDLTPVFAERVMQHGPRKYFLHGKGHLGGQGNRLVAEELIRQLDRFVK